MKKKIDKEKIEEILKNIKIENVISKELALKKTDTLYFAKCPFHKERTGSFCVIPYKQFYYCYGCGASGNAINFLMSYKNKSFLESVKILSGYAGIKIK